MRVNPRQYRESFTRAALRQELRCQLSELRALLLYFGSAEVVLLYYYDYVHYT